MFVCLFNFALVLLHCLDTLQYYLLIHSPVDEHLDCFQILALMNVV